MLSQPLTSSTCIVGHFCVITIMDIALMPWHSSIFRRMSCVQWLNKSTMPTSVIVRFFEMFSARSCGHERARVCSTSSVSCDAHDSQCRQT
jgi:hypothetical protein